MPLGRQDCIRRGVCFASRKKVSLRWMKNVCQIWFLGLRGKWNRELRHRLIINVYSPCSLEKKWRFWHHQRFQHSFLQGERRREYSISSYSCSKMDKVNLFVDNMLLLEVPIVGRQVFVDSEVGEQREQLATSLIGFCCPLLHSIQLQLVLNMS